MHKSFLVNFPVRVFMETDNHYRVIVCWAGRW